MSGKNHGKSYPRVGNVSNLSCGAVGGYCRKAIALKLSLNDCSPVSDADKYSSIFLRDARCDFLQYDIQESIKIFSLKKKFFFFLNIK